MVINTYTWPNPHVWYHAAEGFALSAFHFCFRKDAPSGIVKKRVLVPTGYATLR